MPKKINISIIGATGYLGIELLRILINHPNVNIKHLISKSQSGKKISDVHPHLQQICDKKLSEISLKKAAQESNVVFLAVPHLESKKIVKEINGLSKIIDLSSDFRLKNDKSTHDFQYCLPEINKVKSDNIANPGCFATACQLALYPVKDLIKTANVVAITGSSGSGKTPSETSHHPIRNHNIKSYKIGIHQHLDEISQNLDLDIEKINFVPTSGPFTRGIHLTAFIELTKNCNALDAYKKAYANKPFIRLKNCVELAQIIGSNFCDISIYQNKNHLIIQTATDNLLKGAAGTAVQNFNLLNKLDEKVGLINLTPLYP